MAMLRTMIIHLNSNISMYSKMATYSQHMGEVSDGTIKLLDQDSLRNPTLVHSVPQKNISYSIIAKSQITIEKTILRFLGVLHSLL